MLPQILIIEDEKDWKDLFQDVLHDMGVTVESVSTTQDALTSIKENQYDLIIHDLCLGYDEFNGICRKFLCDLNRMAPEIPIIATTAKELLPEEIFHLRDHGVIEYYNKLTMKQEQFQRRIELVLENLRLPREENKQLALSRKKAYGQYLEALQREPKLKGATDEEIYNWIVKHHDETDELLQFPTWRRYVSEARAYYDTRKHNKRHYRNHGRSIVCRDQI